MRIARILTLAAVAGLLGCGRTVPSAPSDTGASAGSDKERLQGVWKIESFDAGDPLDKISDEEKENLRFVFQGDNLRLAKKGREMQEKFAIALDTNQNPKVMILTELDEDGLPRRKSGTGRERTEVEREEWIFMFDGDTLVVGLREGHGNRPTEFKADRGKPSRGGGTAKGGPGYDPGIPPTVVVRLNKVDEAPPLEPRRTSRSGATSAKFSGTKK